MQDMAVLLANPTLRSLGIIMMISTASKVEVHLLH